VDPLEERPSQSLDDASQYLILQVYGIGNGAAFERGNGTFNGDLAIVRIHQNLGYCRHKTAFFDAASNAKAPPCCPTSSSPSIGLSACLQYVCLVFFLH